MSGGPIQAGCSYNATQLPADSLGTSYQIACPSGCESSGGLWGTDIYTADSAICRAGIHAGAIAPGGGVVTVQTQPGRPAYRGSARNGIQSSDYGSYGKSYAVVNAGSAVQARTSAPAGPQVIEAGCSYNATQIEDAPGTAHVVSCPAGCAGSGGLWGTDVYTADSGICKAAVHAGLLTDRGGTVAVILDAGRPAYRGSSRNGITSSDYGSYAKSFRLQRP
jgi:LCCL domain